MALTIVTLACFRCSIYILQLKPHELTLEALNDAEVALFDSVIAYENLDPAVIGRISTAAESADIADGSPNKSLAVLADCVAEAVTRRAVLDRLAAANNVLDCRRSTQSVLIVGNRDRCSLPLAGQGHACDRRKWMLSSDFARARVLFARLSCMPQQELSARLHTLVTVGDPESVLVASLGVADEINCSGTTVTTAETTLTTVVPEQLISSDVTREITKILANFSSQRAASTIWKLDPCIMAILCEADFEIFQSYICNILHTLQRAVERQYLNERQAMASLLTPGADVAGLCFVASSPSAVLKETDFRVQALCHRCGYDCSAFSYWGARFFEFFVLTVLY
jgi:hypothetical protein